MKVGQVAAIKKQGVILLAERRNELIHNAGRNTYKFVFRLLSEFDQRDRVRLAVQNFFPEDRRADFNRSRGAKARFTRHVSTHHKVHAGQFQTISLHELRDAAKVIAPGMLFIFLHPIKVKLNLVLKIDGVSADFSICSPATRVPHRAINRRGQDEALVVIRVLANQIYAARSASHHFRLQAEYFTKTFFNPHEGELASLSIESHESSAPDFCRRTPRCAKREPGQEQRPVIPRPFLPPENHSKMLRCRFRRWPYILVSLYFGAEDKTRYESEKRNAAPGWAPDAGASYKETKSRKGCRILKSPISESVRALPPPLGAIRKAFEGAAAKRCGLHTASAHRTE